MLSYLIEKTANLILLNKFVYKQYPPLIFLDFNKTSRTWSLKSGLDVRLINEMSKYFNFSMKIIECNRLWGIQLPNKTWSGIIGKIVSKVQFTYLTARNTSKTLINKKAYLYY